MDSLLHPDPDVRASLRAWGVEPETAAWLAARRLFRSFDDMLHYVRVGYLRVGSNACRAFFASFISNSGDGTVDDQKSYMTGEGGLARAHQYGVQRGELNDYALFVNCWNRAQMENLGSRLADEELLENAWEFVFQRLGRRYVEKLVQAGDRPFSAAVVSGTRALLNSGLAPKEIREYLLSFHEPGPDDVGFRNYFTVNEVLEMHAAGVPAAYAMEFTQQDVGVKLLPVVLRLWKDEVPTEYAVPCLVAGLDADTIGRMSRQGLPLDYATSVGKS